jgi:predicted nucleotidyltransferase
MESLTRDYEYQKYEITELTEIYSKLSSSNEEVIAIWKSLESNHSINQQQICGKYALYLQQSELDDVLTRTCIPNEPNWIQAKNNNGIYVDEANKKIYVIKKDATLKILDQEECEIESQRRLEIFDDSQQLILAELNKFGIQTTKLELFGSVAKGCANENSDIDIHVSIDYNSTTRQERIALREKLENIEKELKQKHDIKFQLRPKIYNN